MFAKLVGKQRRNAKLIARQCKKSQAKDQPVESPDSAVLKDIQMHQKSFFVAQNTLAKQQMELKEMLEEAASQSDLNDLF